MRITVDNMHTTELFLIAVIIIYTLPYLIWRVSLINDYIPLVVIQIISGIILGPGVLGAKYPEYYQLIFNSSVIQSLNGISCWAIMIFVWIAGVELDLTESWKYRKESGITAALALSMPLLFGAGVGFGLLQFSGWIGQNAVAWQFILGIGLTCAVTALPILIILMENLNILRKPLGQRILRYASLDDIAVWIGLTIILLDWQRIIYQGLFFIGFIISAYCIRKLMQRLNERDRWHIALIILTIYGYAAEFVGLHFIVGALLAGVILDHHWFSQQQMDLLRGHVLLFLMPVFFLSVGLKTYWQLNHVNDIILVAALLLFVSVVGKLLGISIAGKVLNWSKGEASIIGWLLQTKALVVIVVSNVLLDKAIISHETFSALLFLAIGSTVLTTPIVSAKLKRIEIE